MPDLRTVDFVPAPETRPGYPTVTTSETVQVVDPFAAAGVEVSNESQKLDGDSDSVLAAIDVPPAKEEPSDAS